MSREKDMDRITKELERAYQIAMKEQYKDALAMCNRVVSEYPKLPDGFRKRAAIYARKGDFQAAIGDISIAIEIDPSSSEHYFFRGWWQLEIGNFIDAETDQSNAIALGEEQGSSFFGESAYFFRALARLKLGKFREALADCEHVRDDFLIYLKSIGKITKSQIVTEAMRNL